MMDKVTIEAVGAILKEERGITDAQIKSIEAKLGDEGLVPRMAISRVEAQKEAVSRYVDDILLKRSTVVVSKGSVPYHLKALS